ncbi:MAG: hypothetical protein KGO02_13065 [Alphaproteobacteria bacterium]|nr:hypothetical protein [Alphaproteobacteria bacterium]
MKPSLSELLMGLVQELSLRVVPALNDPFVQGSAQLWALLCLLANQEQTRAADTRLKDIREMRTLFGACAELASPKLKPGLQAARAGDDHRLDLTSLDAIHAELSTLLIALHEELEGNAGSDARKACKQIWTYLCSSAQRHALVLPLS